MSLPVRWAVRLNGRPATDRMNPYIEAIECTDKDGGEDDSATLTFNDADGRLALPQKGTPVEIELEGVLVFKGYTDAPESTVSRNGGMTLEVPCTSVDRRGKVKERQSFHKDDCTFEDFIKDAGKRAGITKIRIDPKLSGIKRAYWRANGESFAHLGRRMADELGGTFKIRGTEAVIAARGAGTAPGGGALPPVLVQRGRNLIEARLKPFIGRPRYKRARVRGYDRAKAKHFQEDVEIGAAPGVDAIDVFGEGRADRQSAKDAGGGRKGKSEDDAGGGSCTILLDVTAQAGGPAQVVDIRREIDGTYKIASRTHKVARPSMAETRLELKKPETEGGSEGGSGGGSQTTS